MVDGLRLDGLVRVVGTVVKCVGKIYPPGGGLVFLFFVV